MNVLAFIIGSAAIGAVGGLIFLIVLFLLKAIVAVALM